MRITGRPGRIFEEHGGPLRGRKGDRQTGAYLEVAFIEDPVNQLTLTRQYRQWQWECSSYEFAPERILLES